MRRLLILLCLTFAALPAQASDDGWRGPGWYQVADTIVGPFLWAGPFDDESDCARTLPPNEEDADYACEYLSVNPDW